MSDAGADGRLVLGGLVDVAGIRGPEPTVGMQVMISETGRAICQAHGFFCPDSEVGKGTIDKVMDGQVQVKWEGGKDGAYLCGKYDQYMLVAATTTSTDADSQEAVPYAHVAHHPEWGQRVWWKGNIKVAVRCQRSGSSETIPALGRLVRMVVMVDGEPDEITIPSRCIIPPQPHYKLVPTSDDMGEERSPQDGVHVLKVLPWWAYDTAVRITDTNSRLDGTSALVVALEVQVQIENVLRAPQRKPLADVTLNTYILGSQLFEDGTSYLCVRACTLPRASLSSSPPLCL